MAAKRVAAILAAVLMVVGAVLLRGAIDDAGSDPGGDDDAGGAVVLCVTDLADVCDSLDVDGVRVEVADLDDSLSRLSSATDRPDGWITFAPLDRLAVDATGAPLATGVEELASTDLVLASRAERAGTLAAACGGTLGWRCIGDVAGDDWSDLGGPSSWGRVTPGHDDPETSAVGALTLASATAGWFGRTDITSIDLDADPAFAGWFDRLRRAVPDFVLSSDSALDPLATGRAVDVVGTTAAEVTAAGPAAAERITVAYPEPMGRADAVLVSTGDRAIPAALQRALSEALLSLEGWVPTPDTPNGLPSAGVVVAVRELAGSGR